MMFVASEATAQQKPVTSMPHSIPEFCSTPTITNLGNGAWSNALNWSPSRIPGAGDRVSIAAGTTVTYDVSSNAVVNCVRVDGRLDFITHASTRLTVGTMLVPPGGTLWIGDSSNPVRAGATAEIVIANQPIDLQADPEQWGTGLIGLGKVTMHGAPMSQTFVRAAVEPAAGAASIALANSVSGWRTGDRLVIPDSRHYRNSEVDSGFSPHWEERTLAQVSGSTASLTQALQYHHPGARNEHGALEFLPHVGNLTRTVIIRSEAPNGTRGHVLFTERADVDLRYVALKDLGRTTVHPLDSTTYTSSGSVTHIGTNQIGRYSIHFHHVMGPAIPPANGYQLTLIGNAVDGGLKWGITIHNTHYGLIKDNVIYNVRGASVMTEDGSESHNVFDGNFAVRGMGVGPRDAMGTEGSGFWFRGPNNYIRNNVAANFYQANVGEAAYGFKFFQRYLGNIRVPKFPGADTKNDANVNVVSGHSLPVREFADNEIYGSQNGLTYWWVGSNWRTPEAIGTTTFLRTTIWHTYNNDVYHYESTNITHDGLTIRGENPSSAACCGTGIRMQDYYAKGFVVRNADIQGMKIGIQVSTDADGIQLIENSYLSSQNNIQRETLWSSNSPGSLRPRTVVVRNVRFGIGQAIRDRFDSGPGNKNYTQLDRLHVFDWNGVAGDDFELFWSQQDANYILPQSGGLTNQQSWSQYGTAVAGAIAPCGTGRGGIDGFACNSSTTPPPPPPGPSDSDGDGVLDGSDLCPGTPAGTAVDAQGCPAGATPVDCAVSSWSPWSSWTPISATTEQRTRTRTVLTAPSSGGAACPTLVETQTRAIAVTDSDGDGVPDSSDACPGTAPGTPVTASGCPVQTQPQPVDCQVSAWSAWSAWTPINGTTEESTRTRTMLVPASNGGAGCPILSETRTRPISNLDSDGDGILDSTDACPGTAPGTAVDGSGCPLSTGGSSSNGGCITPDPFTALGGGTCVAGNWLPPGMSGSGSTSGSTSGGSTSSGSTSSESTSSSPSSGGCVGQDPFLILGGGTCWNSRWLPPGMAIPSSPAPTPVPTRTPAPMPTAPTPEALSQGCTTSDPFWFFGGGTCWNGQWLAPGMPIPGGSGSAVTTAPDPTSATPCPGADPFALIAGLVGVCQNGNWIPVRSSGGQPEPDQEPDLVAWASVPQVIAPASDRSMLAEAWTA